MIRDIKSIGYNALMLRRVQNILMVSSRYDSFTFEEDGRFNQVLLSQYFELNLQNVPNTVRVSTAGEALERLKTGSYDLVISMLRIGDMDVEEFCRKVHEIMPGLPIVLLTYNTREIGLFQHLGSLPEVEKVFVWLGNAMLFLAIIKYIEDRMNVEHDSSVAGVQSILLVEDNPRFYSSYLTMLYSEVVRQTQALMDHGINMADKLLRMRARPKILLATNYEEAIVLYRSFRENLAGIITDVEIPRSGKLDVQAGLSFVEKVKSESPQIPVLMQSSEETLKQEADRLSTCHISKNSPSLITGLKNFMQDYLGFGDFIFRLPDGTEIGRAKDLNDLAEMIARIPQHSLSYHAGRNDFSTWLMARTEFALARALKPRRISDFDDIEEIRHYLVGEIDKHRDRSMAGKVAEFSSHTFKASKGFSCIGQGSLGGKGRGLAFFHTLLDKLKYSADLPDVEISVPPTVTLASDIFEEFMTHKSLCNADLPNMSEEEVNRRFLEPELSPEIRNDLREFLKRVKYPIAVRSSSLLEDSSYQPFAGVYRTFMLPNNHSDLEVRLYQLETAVKLVYASVFSRDAVRYIECTPNNIEEEKMAVVIQQLAGKKRGSYFYPAFAGVARSYDTYPAGDTKSEEGVAQVALGMGKTVVDGGRAVRFSPARPKKVYQFSTVNDALDSSQREFLALDLSVASVGKEFVPSEKDVVSLGLEVAERDGLLKNLGSVYSPGDERIYDGVGGDGARLVTFAGVLKGKAYPLAPTLSYLLEIGRRNFSSEIEIEFAAEFGNPPTKPHEFYFLQIRPIMTAPYRRDVNLGKMEKDKLLALSSRALGSGYITGVRDVIYVPINVFKIGKTLQIAEQVGKIAGKIRSEGRPFMMVGPGRWGTTDQWAGIPVDWNHIAGVSCILETNIPGKYIEPSQGSHFFHNVTSLGIGYFSINLQNEKDHLDTGWLDSQPAVEETPFVKRISFPEDLQIIIDGRNKLGAVYKPST